MEPERHPAAGTTAPERVVLRPHYRRQGREVRSLLSDRPVLWLRREEVELFDALADRPAVGDLLARFPGAEPSLSAWHRARVVERLRRAPATAGRPLVVVEPHMHDAAFSVGGRLLQLAGRRRVVVLSVCGRSSLDRQGALRGSPLDAEAVTALRLAESGVVCELLGAEHRALDLPDAPLRLRPAEEWTRESLPRLRDALAAFLAFPPLPGEVRRLARRLAAAILPLDPAELWIPMGVGGHVDHRVTRDACLAFLGDHWDRLGRRPVLLYEDHPFADHFPHQPSEIRRALASRGTPLVTDEADVGDVLADKLRLVSIYASQLGGGAAAAAFPRRRAARTTAAGPPTERAYRLGGRPRLPAASKLAPDAWDLADLRRRLDPWLMRRHRVRRLAVLCGGPVGRWPVAARLLLAAFPSARIHCYVGADAWWELAGVEHPRLQTVRVPRRGWGGVLVREAARLASPTIVVRFTPWGTTERWRHQVLKHRPPLAWRALQGMLSLALPLRPRLACRHLGDLCGLLAEQLGIDPTAGAE